MQDVAQQHVVVSKHPVQVPDPAFFLCVQRWGVTLADDFVPSAATTEYTSFLLRAAEHEVSAHVLGCWAWMKAVIAMRERC